MLEDSESAKLYLYNQTINIIKEIIDTEKIYIKDLQTIYFVIY